MNRRTLLQYAGAAGLTAVSGCLSGGDGDGDSGDRPTYTTERQPVVTGVDFAIRRRTSGQQRDDATVSIDESSVTVVGTIWGSNGCKTAEPASVTYDPDANELTVAVQTVDKESGEGVGCTQAIVEIEYRVVVSMSYGLPGTVVVTHDRGDGPKEVTRTQ